MPSKKNENDGHLAENAHDVANKINMFVGGGFLLYGLLSLNTTGATTATTNIMRPILAVYYVMFGAFMIMSYCKVKCLVKYCGFIYNLYGRAFFYLFCAMMCLLNHDLLLYIGAIAMLICSVATLILACMHAGSKDTIVLEEYLQDPGEEYSRQKDEESKEEGKAQKI
mmetsp:Transcript_5222/g.5798  ORF Transcript_5222/g.5798 Transcript_5222/m.5798 type:complete len:168 (+) Transcript_5222:46-549(+)